jgi:hypothetical protein
MFCSMTDQAHLEAAAGKIKEGLGRKVQIFR